MAKAKTVAKSRTNQWGLTLDADGKIPMYGLQFPGEANPLAIELECFRRHLDGPPPGKKKPDTPSASQHFWRICEILWPWDAVNKRGFYRHPWAERMTDAASEHRIVGVSGPGSCGKSDWQAVWGIVNFICDPPNTLVLATSTDIQGGRKRVWGKIEKYWQWSRIALPGKLTRNPPMIRYEGASGQGDNSSLSLIPSSPKYATEASGKLIGLKNQRVVLLGDEMTDISPAVVEAMWNLKANPNFYFIGAANFASMYDPFGMFVTPKDGWNSVTVEDQGWVTEKGYCLHIDGHEAYEINPDGEMPVLSGKTLDRDNSPNKERDPQYWRFVRSFPAPGGSDATVFCEADITKFHGTEAVNWLSTPTVVAGFDPSFSVSGDRCAAYFSKYGTDASNKKVIEAFRFHEIRADTSSEEPPNYQRAKKFWELCQEYGVRPQHVAIDATGGGAVFGEILSTIMGSNDFERIVFGSAPKDEKIFNGDDRSAKDVYEDSSTYAWYDARRFLEFGELKGLRPSLCRELCGRRLQQNRKKLKLEPKSEMVSMRNRSPDEADSFVLSVVACRRRLGALPGGGSDSRSFNSRGSWARTLRRLDVVANSGRELIRS